MRHIEIAESFAQAARQAEARGEHRKAAKLLAEAVKVLKRGPSRLSHFADVPPWSAGASSWIARGEGGAPSADDVPPPPSTVRR